MAERHIEQEQRKKGHAVVQEAPSPVGLAAACPRSTAMAPGLGYGTVSARSKILHQPMQTHST